MKHLHEPLLPLVTIILLAGCTNRHDRAARPDSFPQSVPSPATTGTTPLQKRHGTVQRLPFDTAAVAKEYDHRGAIVGGARWIDSNGRNTLIISQELAPSGLTEDAIMQRIYGYLYVQRDAPPKLLWKIQDQAENACDRGEGLVSDVIVEDLDSDGVAEDLFVYNVAGNCDVSPIAFKLMLHSGATKYAVRGTAAVFDGQDTVGGERHFDPAFDAAPPAFRRAAMRLWEKEVRPPW
jgi:hypothetical protein